jgi:hypothetical protein
MLFRGLVALLAVLAGGKVVLQEYTQRAALRDAVLLAYRDRAARACEFESRALHAALPANAWATSSSVDLRLASLEFWTSARANGPADTAAGHLQLVVGLDTEFGGFVCAYDITTATAVVARS